MRKFSRRKLFFSVFALCLLYLLLLNAFGDQFQIVPNSASPPRSINWALLLNENFHKNVSFALKIPFVKHENWFFLNEQLFVASSSGPINGDWFVRHEFNQQASDVLKSDRNIADFRNDLCKLFDRAPLDYNERLSLLYTKPNRTQSFGAKLPATSVIITFHNEARSTLLRTIVSVLRRSPPELIEEIILVDDYSDQPEVGLILSYLRKVRLLRNDRREGLVRSRLKGAAAAKSTVLTFLDSHCECAWGWLPPLLTRVHQDPSVLAAPVIDILRIETFEYVPASSKLRGTFGWDLVFRWELLPENRSLLPSSFFSSSTSSHQTTIKHLISDSIDPIATPAIAGGLFSISKRTFYALGQYDSEMDVWGGENIELSVRAWLCGARLEIIPCSRVGHVFRRQHPYVFPGGSAYVFARNSRRAAEAWLDRYLPYFYAAKPGVNLVSAGNLDSRLVLKKRLKCRSFDWFVENVYPDLLQQTPKTDRTSTHDETNILVTQTAHNSLTSNHSDVPLLLLFLDQPVSIQTQTLLRYANQICNSTTTRACHLQIVHSKSQLCLAVFKATLQLSSCKSDVMSTTWLLFETTRLRHISGRCISTSRLLHSSHSLSLESCAKTNTNDHWTVFPTNQIALASGHYCLDTQMHSNRQHSLHTNLCDPSSGSQQWTFNNAIIF